MGICCTNATSCSGEISSLQCIANNWQPVFESALYNYDDYTCTGECILPLGCFAQYL